jgi:hypothetical protein
MNYESFRAAWTHALRESRLPMIGLYGKETLELRSPDREHKVYVEPLGGQDAAPFHITATLSWDWRALQTARAKTRDEDVLSAGVAQGHRGVRPQWRAASRGG